MIIGIDVSRANKREKTGTEWYSFFVIQELKKIASMSTPHPSLAALGTPSPEKGEVDLNFILYTNTPLKRELAECPPNFKQKVLYWWPKLLWTQKRLSWEMLVHPPDVLFVPAHTVPIFCRAKTVVTIHDVGFRVEPQLYSWQDKLYHCFSVWFASRFANKIICPSEFTKNELIKYYGTNPKKITVIHHGVRLSEPVFEKNESSKIKDQGSRYLFYVGRIEEKKNIMNLLRAFQIVYNTQPLLRFVLAGRDGHGADQAKDFVKANNLGQAVEFLGPISEERKWQLYRGASTFVFPTLYEGFGMPILEAQAAGCPVLTSDLPPHREVAGEGALYVEPASAQAIAKGILELLDPARAADMRALGIQNSLKFTWQATALATLEVLEDVLKS